MCASRLVFRASLGILLCVGGEAASAMICIENATAYRDKDGDGYGSTANGTALACLSPFSVPSGYTLDNSDCNDNSAAIKPGATEVCEGVDNDCDGQVDEGVKSTFYRDFDSDTYGSTVNGTTQACSAPGGYVGSNSDCNDNNASVKPGVYKTCGVGPCFRSVLACNGLVEQMCSPGAATAEVCDGVDNDCDGQADDSLVRSCYDGPSATAGVGECTAGTQTCTAGTWGACSGQVLPRAEQCDVKDTDCDGSLNNLPQLTCGTGPCARTAPACKLECWYDQFGNYRCVWDDNLCMPGTPVNEVCNGADDDCDGNTDDGVLLTFYS
ncbi:MAG: putative metal-binding motif-containing protein, partial [Myxococcaceae bacterium]|nr:putative metal-binding motif-containing protein [Myxococcaceae bacterium]